MIARPINFSITSPISYNLLWRHSYIRDSKHFLQLLESLPPLPENAILVTADVTSLYTNISHEEGIDTVLHYMKLHADALPPGSSNAHTTAILLETTLKHNNLSFMDKHFPQLVGTAMGTKAAPPYTNFSWAATKKLSGSFHMGNPLLEKVHRWHLPGFPRHY